MATAHEMPPLVGFDDLLGEVGSINMPLRTELNCVCTRTSRFVNEADKPGRTRLLQDCE